jgi:hypothetical protein
MLPRTRNKTLLLLQPYSEPIGHRGLRPKACRRLNMQRDWHTIGLRIGLSGEPRSHQADHENVPKHLQKLPIAN